MKRRRNNLQITAEILKIAMKGARKTHLVYGANLNFKLLDLYLEELEKTGLIHKPVKGTIETTGKGIKYLEHYYELQKFVDSEQRFS